MTMTNIFLFLILNGTLPVLSFVLKNDDRVVILEEKDSSKLALNFIIVVLILVVAIALISCVYTYWDDMRRCCFCCNGK
ncbi:hypothetical protein FQR65_LT00262 [Abscondita terminalis]|nr:hypothetical protein FQR65_LT00262 [Abscondita terminalis]